MLAGSAQESGFREDPQLSTMPAWEGLGISPLVNVLHSRQCLVIVTDKSLEF